MQGKQRQSGMSLLETLIAIVVFSVGTVGVASVMLTSVRNSDATLQRTNSTTLATEMYEMMLANLPAAEAGNYNLAMSADLPQTASVDCGQGSSDCSPAQLAEWDLAQWGARAARIMPQADAAISVDASLDPMVIQIDIQYDELLETDGVTTETFNFRARQ